MKQGGSRRIIIPAALAYGATGHPPVIPPNSVLIFDVTMVSVQ
jgi:peptidylprolyl isomerase